MLYLEDDRPAGGRHLTGHHWFVRPMLAANKAGVPAIAKDEMTPNRESRKNLSVSQS